MSNQDVANDLINKMKVYETEFVKEFVKRVEQRTPVLSGKLKDGYYVEENGNNYELKNREDYAAYVELGTIHQRPAAMVQTTLLEMDDIGKIAKDRAGL